MIDPFKIKGPALISFSGGRTSAYMLWRIVQAWGGELPSNIRATFCNTGKEAEQTLDFVRDCSERWGVEITWLEYRHRELPRHRYAVVNHAMASRGGEPFEEVIRRKGIVPRTTMRFCTTELKVQPMARYAAALGMDDWTCAIGLRADEEYRLARIRSQNQSEKNAWQYVTPLAVAGIKKADISAFWDSQNWGLKLPQHNGNTFLGNCDLCFMKSTSVLRSILRANPELGEWWAKQEESIQRDPGKTNQFRPNMPTYRQMIIDARDNRQIRLPMGDDADRMVDCFCGEAA